MTRPFGQSFRDGRRQARRGPPRRACPQTMPRRRRWDRPGFREATLRWFGLGCRAAVGGYSTSARSSLRRCRSSRSLAEATIVLECVECGKESEGRARGRRAPPSPKLGKRLPGLRCLRGAEVRGMRLQVRVGQGLVRLHRGRPRRHRSSRGLRLLPAMRATRARRQATRAALRLTVHLTAAVS